jgi:integrase
MTKTTLKSSAAYRLGKTNTLADLAALIAKDTSLPARKPKDIRWALHTVAKAVGKPMEATLLDMKALNEMLDAFEPAVISIGEGTWTNAKNLTRYALRHAGLIKALPPRKAPLAPEWSAVMRLLSDQGHLFAIGRLARFCTEQDVNPEQVNDQIFDQLLEELESGQLKSNGRKTHRHIAKTWNSLANSVRGWPNELVRVPCYNKRYAVEWSNLPATLKADIDKYIGELDGSGKRLLTRVKPLKPSTIKTRRHQLHIIISGMVLSGVCPISLKTLADVVKPDNVEIGLQYLLDRVGEGRLAQAHDVLGAIISVARHYVKVSEKEVKDLTGLSKAWAVEQGRGMSDKNRELLRQFGDDAKVLAFLNLPEALVAKAKAVAGRPTRAEALLVQTAMVVALLQHVPIRRHNVAALRMSEHFKRSSDGSVDFYISGKEVKNGVPVDAKLTPQVVRILDLYIKTYRPLLAQKPSDWLIPGIEDRPKSRERLGLQISNTIKREIGVTMHTHLFRHTGALLLLEAFPGAYGMAARLLGHRSDKTTMEIYTGLEARATVAHYANVILARKKGKAVAS